MTELEFTVRVAAGAAAALPWPRRGGSRAVTNDAMCSIDGDSDFF